MNGTRGARKARHIVNQSAETNSLTNPEKLKPFHFGESHLDSMQRNLQQFANRLTIGLVASVFVVATGCQQPLFNGGAESFGLFKKSPDFNTLLSASQKTPSPSATLEDRLAAIGVEKPVDSSEFTESIVINGGHLMQTGDLIGVRQSRNSEQRMGPDLVFAAGPIVRAQSQDWGSSPQDDKVVQAGGQTDDSGEVRLAQYPEFDTSDRAMPLGNGLASPNVGSPNELNPLVQPYERGGNGWMPQNYADLDVYVTETQTGRINFGGAYNSDNGIVGQFTVDEKNFDIGRFPRSFREILDGTAWRGAGQTFRLELVPGANVKRYLVSFTEPYMFGTDYSFSASGYLFDRRYFDWDENRLGGRFAVGRRLTPDLSISAGVRLESVTIDNRRVLTSTELNNSLGTSNLFLGNIGLIRDTRDSTTQATEGSFLSMTYSQAFGDYSYSRGDLDFRTYRLMYERPDGSGRHTVSFGTKLGFSGSSTPIFENYFAGGFSTIRGFDFRGASPVQDGVRVGGEFQWLNTLEYMFPLTASDMVKGVLFCDFGTVEQSVALNSENYRVAPGFGFRVSMPGAGIGAPLAFDFAFPVTTADGDDEKVFSFYLGVLR